MLRFAKVASVCVCVCVGVLVSGCASSIPNGGLYTGVQVPVSGNGEAGSKTGTASCTSIIGLIAIGDCSVATAARAGGISNIKSVDRKVVNYLGLYGKYTTIVRGD
ncbi:TRL-like family protein [Helicobacter ailurogastricus]|uniref:Protein trl n=1 Tax=Helicobacter ailurogastricus TaxID=1578720 RepID=A0A0K2XZY5_9HELI|nr:TRL-like family protein [Helicobacter ailurogastricus]BDQ29795.1 TRL family protein [Helicobacter ailurogastricus]CRF52661.1 Protein trl [Helicobacter ailurogastricus]